MKSEVLRVTHELQAMKDKIKENTEKIKVNKTLPYLVSNVIEVLFHGGIFGHVKSLNILHFLFSGPKCFLHDISMIGSSARNTLIYLHKLLSRGWCPLRCPNIGE